MPFKREVTTAAFTAVFFLFPAVAGATALNTSGGGKLNASGGTAVAVTGNGVTSGCINFYTSATPNACGLTPGSIKVVGPSDANLFTLGDSATIKDIPAPPLAEMGFITVPGPGGAVHFNLSSLIPIAQTACSAGDILETCGIGYFTLTQYNCGSGGCYVSVSFSANANAYTGASTATGYTPYVITFSTQFSPGSFAPNDTNIGTIVTLLGTPGGVQSSVSLTASPSGPNVTGFSGCTVTQGGWGAPPHGNNPGEFLVRNFAAAFPSGATIGGSPYSLHFTSASAVMGFLPQGGPPGSLNASATNPTARTSAGVFAGQVLAFELNVVLEKAGTLTLSNTGTSLDGQTLSAVLAAANLALGGGPLPSGFASYSSLNDLIDSLNQSFDGCAPDGFATGHLM